MGKDCDATYSFQTFPNRSVLRLALNISVKEDLKMLLVSGPCWVNCSGGESECEVTVTQHKWSPLQHSVDLFDMPPGNYCVQLYEINCEDCCVVCTQTEELTANQNEMAILLHMQMTQFLILGFLLTICFLLMAIILFTQKKAHIKQIESIGVTCKTNDTKKVPVEIVKNQPLTNVLLIYSRDSPLFCQVIECLRRLIMKLENVKVHDYMEELQTQNTPRNIVEWLTNYLQSPNTKIILVISKGALLYQEAILRNQRVFLRDPHHLDSVFSYALCYLHNDYILSRNYKRIFSVRFEDIVGEHLSLNFIAPLKCFILMKHINKLIMEIQGVPAPNDSCINECSAYYFPEIQDLTQSLNKFKSSGKEKSLITPLDWT